MHDVGGTTALALTAFFGLCVPGVSNGKIEQKVSTSLLVPLTDAERKEFAGASEGEDAAFRVKSEEHLVLVTTKGGHCHVVTADGDTQRAKDAFLESLKTAGGTEEDMASTKPQGTLEVRGIIWVNPQHDGVVVGFSAEPSGDKGFYAWAFGIHKD
jgi:hypothetical protein